MADYNKPSIGSGFNDNPPPDDGTEVTSNEVTWSKHLTKLANPLKAYIDAVNDAVQSRFNVTPDYSQTQAEIDAGVTPSDTQYQVGDIRRWGDNATPGTTDMTTVIQNGIDVLSQGGGGVLRLRGETYAVSAVIKLKSNVTLAGEGWEKTKLVGTSWGDSSNYRVIHLDREDGAHTDVFVKNLEITSADTAKNNNGAALQLQRVTNFGVEGVKVIDGSDACIRVDGYGDGTFVDDPEDPFWNNTRGGYIRHCHTLRGSTGIEIEGGAEDIDVSNNNIEGHGDGSQQHALRISSGYNIRIFGNDIRGANRAIWLDRHRDIFVWGNKLTCQSTQVIVDLIGFDQTAVSLDSENVFINENVFYGDDVRCISDSVGGTSDRYSFNVHVFNNRFDTDNVHSSASITFRNARSVHVCNNIGIGGEEVNLWNGASTGSVINNRMGLQFDASYDKLISKGGSDVIVHGNIDPSTLTSGRPAINFAPLGAAAAAPTSGTYEAGDLIFNGEPAAGEPLGWICVSDGSPGTWIPFGGLQSASAWTDGGAHSVLRDTTGTSTAGEALQLIETLVADLKSAGILQ